MKKLSKEDQRLRNGTAAKGTRTKKKFIGIASDRLAAHALRLATATAGDNPDAAEIRRLAALIRETRRRSTRVHQKGAADTELDDFTVSTDVSDVPLAPKPLSPPAPQPPPPASRARRAPQPSRVTKSSRRTTRTDRAGVPAPPRDDVNASPERQIAHYFPL